MGHLGIRIVKPYTFVIICSFILSFFDQAGAQSLQNVRTNSYVSFEKSASEVPLFESGKSGPYLIYDAADHKGIIRVIGHLKDDFKAVTGVPFTENKKIAKTQKGIAIIVGSINSKLIQNLVKSKKLEVGFLTGKWEQFLITTLDKPMKGIEKAMVIVGSDKRGTIYGIYDFVEKIGVSPWHYWADVPIESKNYIGIKSGKYSDGEPKVKYRGIFINDEAPALTGWVEATFGGFNHQFYDKVFDLILRLKGNYLWPAMWGKSLYDDDSESSILADEYGVVLGTSHHEPLMRAHVEWTRYHKDQVWNYQKNEDTLKKFWREGIQRMGSKESIISVGMRGDGDEPMSRESNIDLLERIVKDQRQIIEEVTGKPASAAPQLWALYKEVQEYYDKGMRVPDDITLLLCDDNWGNIRKLPKPDAAPRSGGYGIYFHYDYVGGPRNYKWINTNSIPRVWEQMSMAFDHGVDRIWIVNVGDLKPMDLPTSFFLDLAWNPTAMDQPTMLEYSTKWAKQQFGDYKTNEIARLLDLYTQYNARRKHELLNIPAYSLTQENEFANVVADYKALEIEAAYLMGGIDRSYYDAFYQLVYYPIAASSNMYQLYHGYFRNLYEAEQGRNTTNVWADVVDNCFVRDSFLTKYHNEKLANGKWPHLMDQTHIGYTYWQQPRYNNIPKYKRIEIPTKGHLGVQLEGSNTAMVADSMNEVTLSSSSSLELFNTGLEALSYTVSENCNCIAEENKKGLVIGSKTIGLNMPVGKKDCLIEITGAGSTFRIKVNFITKTLANDFRGYFEKNGMVGIDPTIGGEASKHAVARWDRISRFGRNGDGLKVFPTTLTVSEKDLDEESPHITYPIYVDKGGIYNVAVWLAPTIDFYDKGGLKFGISNGMNNIKIVNIHEKENGYNWDKSVSQNINKVNTTVELKAGVNYLSIWHIDPGLVFEKIVLSQYGKTDGTYLGIKSTYSK